MRTSSRKGFPARVQALVRQRAGYRCEACGTWVIGRSGGACLPVVRERSGVPSSGVPEEVLASAANAEDDPRRLPMTVSRDGAGQRTVWRSVDGAYLTEPPALVGRQPVDGQAAGHVIDN